MPIIVDCIQGDETWKKCRLGRPTTSNFGKILTATGKISESRIQYMKVLAGEAISGRSEDNFLSYRMKEGSRMEAESRQVYAMENEIEIRKVGFVFKDERRLCGCSPDGFIDPSGGFETKDANFALQIDRVFDGRMVTKHIPQCQGGMYVCEREYWIFRSYCSGLPPLDIRLERDEKYISRLDEEIEKFAYELATMIRKLKELQ